MPEPRDERWVNAEITLVIPLDGVPVDADPVVKQEAVSVAMTQIADCCGDRLSEAMVGRWADMPDPDPSHLGGEDDSRRIYVCSCGEVVNFEMIERCDGCGELTEPFVPATSHAGADPTAVRSESVTQAREALRAAAHAIKTAREWMQERAETDVDRQRQRWLGEEWNAALVAVAAVSSRLPGTATGELETRIAELEDQVRHLSAGRGLLLAPNEAFLLSAHPLAGAPARDDNRAAVDRAIAKVRDFARDYTAEEGVFAHPAGEEGDDERERALHEAHHVMQSVAGRLRVSNREVNGADADALSAACVTIRRALRPSDGEGRRTPEIREGLRLEMIAAGVPGDRIDGLLDLAGELGREARAAREGRDAPAREEHWRVADADGRAVRGGECETESEARVVAGSWNRTAKAAALRSDSWPTWLTRGPFKVQRQEVTVYRTEWVDVPAREDGGDDGDR